MHWFSTSIVAAAFALAFSVEAPTEEITATDRSIASGRDTIIEGDLNQGATQAEVEDIIAQTLSDRGLLSLVEATARGVSVAANEKIGELSEQLNLHREALARMFGILDRDEVPPERLGEELAELARLHQRLLKRKASLNAVDPRVAELRDAASAAIDAAEYEEADALLAEAEAAELEAIRDLREALTKRTLSAAALRVERGEVARTKPDYRTAASHFGAAAELMPAGYEELHTEYLLRQAGALEEHGTDFGEAAALRS